MPKSQIIKDLVEDCVSLEKSLTRLLILAKDINNSKLVQWTEKELKGYKPNDDVPEYRYTKCAQLQYSGLNGNFQVTNIPLSKSWIREDLINGISSVIATDGIRYIEHLAANKKGAACDLTELAGEVSAATDGSISCTSIRQIIPQSFYLSICAEVKNKMITALMELEKKYGNLDGLGIDISGKQQVQIDSFNSDLNRVVFNINVPQEEIKKDPWYSKIAWNIIAPIITGIFGAVVAASLIKCFGW